MLVSLPLNSMYRGCLSPRSPFICTPRSSGHSKKKKKNLFVYFSISYCLTVSKPIEEKLDKEYKSGITSARLPMCIIILDLKLLPNVCLCPGVGHKIFSQYLDFHE